MAQGKREEAMALKEEVTKQAQQLAELEKAGIRPFCKGNGNHDADSKHY